MKQWFILERSDVFVMLLSYPAVFLANYLSLGEIYIQRLSVFIPITLVITVLYFLFAWLMDAWMKYMRYRFSSLQMATQRIFYCLLVYIVMMVVLVGLVSNIVSVGVTESTYSYSKWKESVAREYELKQLHMQQQLDVLKQQVNPHFLFNSLNSLIALIGENPRQAEAFAEELSSVYRYVLRANEQNLTDLSTELDFIHSYYHLLKTRHGNGLHLNISVDERFNVYQLPPLTLQLLVENAVKHNVTLPDQPLSIEITSDSQARLSVCNTIRKKPSRVLSNGVGLSNILAKYQVLGQPAPTVQETDGRFVVTLPLIPNP